MSLRTKPIFRVGNRPNHFLGGDREVVFFFGLIGVVLLLHGATVLARAGGVILWLFGLSWSRAMVKRDPLWRQVWLRRLRYQGRYLAHATPFRVNTPRQGRRYR